MSWVTDLKQRVQSHFEKKKQAEYAKYVDARGISKGTKTYAQYTKGEEEPKSENVSAVAKIKQAGEARDASLEEALTPKELAKFGYKKKGK